MFSKFRKPFNLINPVVHNQSLSGKTSYGHGGYGGYEAGTVKGSVAVGLGILVQISQVKSNIIVKPALRLSQPTITCSSFEFSCFLKTCHLCNKGLSLDKEVYMYRGDLGFCSIECRNRRIVIDEKRELEASTKQMLASYRRGQHRCSSTKSGLSVDVHLQQERIPHHRNIFALNINN